MSRESAWTGRHQGRLLSFQSHLRAQYALAVACVAVLALTGLPQKFESLSLSRSAIDVAGGIENLRLAHQVAGGALVFTGVYHVVLVLVALIMLREPAPLRMIPTGRDCRDAMQAAAYFAGLRRVPPDGGYRRYFSKIDYWFVTWSLGVMALSGLVNLFPLRAARLSSTDVVLAALRAHSDAAPLVVVWVAIVHLMYMGLTPRLFQRERPPEHAGAPAPVAGALGSVPSARFADEHAGAEWEEVP